MDQRISKDLRIKGSKNQRIIGSKDHSFSKDVKGFQDQRIEGIKESKDLKI